MAPTRRSHLEQAGLALLALLNAIEGVVRGLADKTHSGRDSLEADKAKSNSAARAVPVPDESHAQCPPRRGWLVTRKWHMSEVSRDYQARITGLPPFTEWIFENIEFDGFRAPECRLQEAKAQYDQFFDRTNPSTKRVLQTLRRTSHCQPGAHPKRDRREPPTGTTDLVFHATHLSRVLLGNLFS